MSYSRIPDDSVIDGSNNEKEDLVIQSRPGLIRFFSYRNLLGAALALWITTSVVLGWVLVQKPTEYGGNHVVTLLPFPPGINCEPDKVYERKLY
jgi:hypothetical protein